MTDRVLLLSPSRGLGGGIERYLCAVEWALAAQGVEYQRVDLDRPGVRAHARMLAMSRVLLQNGAPPTRLVPAHRVLLPVARLLAHEPAVSGISVLCHGSDVWGPRASPRSWAESRLLRGTDVRTVAVSNFTAGVLFRNCPATVLPPGLSGEWFRALVDAAGAVHDRGPGIRLLTAFRLADWLDKGLPELVAAVELLGRSDVHLTVCGHGTPPPGLARLMDGHPRRTLRADLTDGELAQELASADLFVLAARTRPGRRPCGEGFGLVLLEAQVAGTAVVAPAYGGSHDAFVSGTTGVAPADETPRALAAVLGELLADPARIAEMGKRAAEWSRDVFAPHRYPPLVVASLL